MFKQTVATALLAAHTHSFVSQHTLATAPKQTKKGAQKRKGIAETEGKQSAIQQAQAAQREDILMKKIAALAKMVTAVLVLLFTLPLCCCSCILCAAPIMQRTRSSQAQ